MTHKTRIVKRAPALAAGFLAAVTAAPAMAQSYDSTFTFETPNVGNTYINQPSVPNAVFSGNAGIVSAVFADATLPAGSKQAAVLQYLSSGGGGSLALTYTGLTPGQSYTASF